MSILAQSLSTLTICLSLNTYKLLMSVLNIHFLLFLANINLHVLNGLKTALCSFLIHYKFNKGQRKAWRIPSPKNLTR